MLQAAQGPPPTRCPPAPAPRRLEGPLRSGADLGPASPAAPRGAPPAPPPAAGARRPAGPSARRPAALLPRPTANRSRAPSTRSTGTPVGPRPDRAPPPHPVRAQRRPGEPAPRLQAGVGHGRDPDRGDVVLHVAARGRGGAGAVQVGADAAAVQEGVLGQARHLGGEQPRAAPRPRSRPGVGGGAATAARPSRRPGWRAASVQPTQPPRSCPTTTARSAPSERTRASTSSARPGRS